MDEIHRAPLNQDPYALRNYVVLGIFRSRQDLERGVSLLRAKGFRNSDVSALIPSPETVRDLAHQAGSKAPEGATAGMVAGAIIGGTLGWLVGGGSLAIPGIGPLLAAGPIVATLAGIGAGSAVGGLAGGLIGFGIPEYEAKRYEGHIQGGGILLTVHCDDADWSQRAENILTQCGASDISSTREAHRRREEPYSSPPLSHPH